MDDTNRSREHRRNPVLEALLAELAADLAPLGDTIASRGGAPRHPAVFVVGCPRSGTTLTYQWLASLGAFTYPSNLVSRFPTAPWLGARVQRLLTDPACDHLGELGLERETDPAPFTSRLGKTRGLLAPGEFWYWWRRFLPANETHELTSAQTRAVDVPRLRAELGAWEAVLDRPLLMKGLILNWNLPWLAEAVPGCVFVHIERDPLLNMQSLLSARRDFFGDLQQWYSFRPPQFTALRDASPAAQVAGQVFHTTEGVRRGLARIAPARQLQVTYAELCRNPAGVHGRLRETLGALGCELPVAYEGPQSFEASETLRLPPEQVDELRAAWAAVQVSAGA